MKIIQILASNGALPLVPILLWNILFARKLPPAYASRVFDAHLPALLKHGENFFRTVVFMAPVFIQTKVSTPAGRQGLVLYLCGVFLYFTSWLILMLAPQARWSRSVAGLAAPAYTPLIWLIGLSRMFNVYYFGLPYAPWHFLAPALVFLSLHCLHAFRAFSKLNA